MTAHRGGTSILHVSKARCSFKYRAKNRSAWACSFFCEVQIVIPAYGELFCVLWQDLPFFYNLDQVFVISRWQFRPGFSEKLNWVVNSYWELVGFRKSFIVLSVLLTLLWLIVFSQVFLFYVTLQLSESCIQLNISSCLFTELVLVCSVSYIFIMKYFVTKWVSTVLRNVKRIKRIAYWSVNHSSSKNSV